jgi:hypothetical protein
MHKKQDVNQTSDKSPPTNDQWSPTSKPISDNFRAACARWHATSIPKSGELLNRQRGD